MANKEFKIQSNTVSLNGVPLSASADNKVVIPGVTRATGYNVKEVEDRDIDQNPTFGTPPLVIDNAWYFKKNGGTLPSFSIPQYLVTDLDDDGDAAYQTPHNGNGSTNIGCFGAGGNLLNGKIGRVLCFNRELSAEEVEQVFNATRNRYGI